MKLRPQSKSLLFLLSTLACGTISSPSLIIQVYSGDPEIVSALESAQDRVERATGLTSEWHPYDVLFNFGELPSDTVGLWNPDTKDVTIAEWLSSDRVELIVLHEYGHVLGARDLANGSGVMAAAPHPNDYLLTESDITEICLRSANPCTRFEPEL